MMNVELKALIYGDSGVGKTWLLGTFQDDPRSSPVLHLNAQGQKITLRLREEQPCVVELEQLTDINAPFNWLLNGQLISSTKDPAVQMMQEYLAGWGRAHDDPNPRFRTLTLDSVTYVQRLSANKIISNDALVLPGNIPPAAKIQDWGRIFAQLSNMTLLFKGLPMHVIFTTICRRENIIGTDIATAYPFIWGQGAMEVPSLLDMVGHLITPAELNLQQRKALEPMGINSAYNVLLCGHRVGKVTKWQGVRDPPPLIIAPTATKLLDVLEG